MKKSFFLFSIVVLLNSHAMSQMYVAWNGNVGIGTTTPSCKFQIKSSIIGMDIFRQMMNIFLIKKNLKSFQKI